MLCAISYNVERMFELIKKYCIDDLKKKSYNKFINETIVEYRFDLCCVLELNYNYQRNHGLTDGFSVQLSGLNNS